MRRLFLRSIEAGVLISIGCTVYLSCGNRYVGAVLFSTALCAICTLDKALFTGMVCFVSKTKELPGLLVCLTGNVLGCVAGASLMGIALLDADALIFSELVNTALAKAGNPVDAGFQLYMQGYETLFQEAIKEAPTINPEDLRPKGRWIDCTCSVCKFDALYLEHSTVQVLTGFCPNCGTKM